MSRKSIAKTKAAHKEEVFNATLTGIQRGLQLTAMLFEMGIRPADLHFIVECMGVDRFEPDPDPSELAEILSSCRVWLPYLQPPPAEVLAQPLKQFLAEVSQQHLADLPSTGRPADQAHVLRDAIKQAQERTAWAEAEAQRLSGLAIPTPEVFFTVLQEAGRHMIHIGDLLDPVSGLAALRDDWEIRGDVCRLRRCVQAAVVLTVELAQEMRGAMGQ